MEKKRDVFEMIKIIFAVLFILAFVILCLAVPSRAEITGTPVSAIQAELGTPVADIRAELGVVPPGTTVTVLPGDTYSGIAQKFCKKGVGSLFALVKANRISVEEADLIYPGDEIFIPSELLRPTFRDPLRKVENANKRLGALSAENARLNSILAKVRIDSIDTLYNRRAKEAIAAIIAIFIIILLGLSTFLLRKEVGELVADERELKLALTKKESEKIKERNEEIASLLRERRNLKLALKKERELVKQLGDILSRKV
ncbi:MAG: LysM peptidoglycan-binding domain-containing protein [bacterium]|nr:LysM peptidoglycan-binding domain-containing protein [bacterium]